MGQSVAENPPGSPSRYPDCSEALLDIADASNSDLGTSHAWSDDIEFGMLSSSIATDFCCKWEDAVLAQPAQE